MSQKAKRNGHLPDECWELIFHRLGHHYHFEVISLVCKFFLSISNGLKRTLTIHDHPSIRFHCNLSNLFRRFHKLSTIVLRCREMSEQELNDILVEIARSGLDLHELHVSDWSSIDMDVLRELGSAMKKLRFLSLLSQNHSSLKDSDLVVIACSMPLLQQLDFYDGDIIKVLARNIQLRMRQIDMGDKRFVSDKGLIELSLNCKFLTKLVIGNLSDSCSITENGIGFALRHCQNLTYLCISGMKGTSSVSSEPSTLFSIENSISHARALCDLHIGSMDVSDALLYSIAKARLPLKNLSLLQCKIFTYSGLSFLLREYRSISHLRLQSVSFLTDQMMNDLSMFLRNVTRLNICHCFLLTARNFLILTRKCPFLVELRLTCLRLGQGGNFGLEQTENHNIKSLDLSCCTFLNDESLISFVLVCPNIQSLNLGGCPNITENGIGEILKSCSKLMQLEVTMWGRRSILGTGSKLSELNLEVLKAKNTDIDDEGMEIIGLRCRRLLKLELKNCKKVTEKGVKEVLEKCINLREINLLKCNEMNSDMVPWMMSLRPSLREIVLPSGQVSKEVQRNLFLRHGCVVRNE